MNEEKIKRVLRGISHTGYTTELERCEARICIEQLQHENTQLKENWDKLEEWIKEVDFLHFNKAILLDKMNELKGNTKK